MATQQVQEKDVAIDSNAAATAPDVSDSESQKEKDLESHKQHGVANVEAMTRVWTKKALWVVIVLLYGVFFAIAFMRNVAFPLEPYVTSAFRKHGLLAIVSIVSTLAGGVSQLAIAKLFDIWGRPQGFAVAVFLVLMGLILKAVCQNVQTYAAGNVFWWVGATGLSYAVDVFVSDVTSLRNRGLVFGVNSTPGLAAIFAGPAIAQELLQHSSFRWGYGLFCIVIPAITIPVIFAFAHYERKAKKLGVAHEAGAGRTAFESIKHYVIEFDVMGMLLTIAGFSLILLPFSLASGASHKWANPSIIAMIVVGVLCLVSFVIWEKWFAPVQYLPFRYLKDRTILGVCICRFALYITIRTWDIYMSSYLQVVQQVNVRNAGYIMDTYSLTAFVVMPITGLALRYMKQPKYLGIAAIPLIALGTGLLVKFRVPGQSSGLIAMCQVFNGAAGGILDILNPIMVMASVSHQEVAVVLALTSMFTSIGSSVGSAISGALWTNLLPKKLEFYLPDEFKNETMTIYGDLKVQLSYPYGSPVREAIVHAYGDVMRLMVIAGAAFVPLVAASIFVWKNLHVKDMKQTKGTVF
ncbi:MFS general substrate transporter [Aaosphaeria arxii CBS 175.79]|uniref:MFS general substrate transporter n=1 Tax=Aaosphaeria arxii CBS 175.79 TaxID=1450172 RepID=A0A6A5XAN1_9PLEO|nr:MFS general substrate transporter [Aaosphaeria arxii CBS 175.79]KAF2010125.1 MFS general substrate transporter [Aaosphaeria arxii CBS 175.79]